MFRFGLFVSCLFMGSLALALCADVPAPQRGVVSIQVTKNLPCRCQGPRGAQDSNVTMTSGCEVRFRFKGGKLETGWSREKQICLAPEGATFEVTATSSCDDTPSSGVLPKCGEPLDPSYCRRLLKEEGPPSERGVLGVFKNGSAPSGIRSFPGRRLELSDVNKDGFAKFEPFDIKTSVPVIQTEFQKMLRDTKALHPDAQASATLAHVDLNEDGVPEMCLSLSSILYGNAGGEIVCFVANADGSRREIVRASTLPESLQVLDSKTKGYRDLRFGGPGAQAPKTWHWTGQKYE